MRLFEHPDFRDILIATAEDRDVPEQIVEKDYYVTEVLRIVATDLGDAGIFKGGTSLSKGWNLIRRFSEDIDLFVNPVRDGRRLSNRSVDRELERLHALVAEHPGLSITPVRKTSAKERADLYTFPTRFPAFRGVRPEVLLESGVFSGKQPTETRALSSYAADFLRERDLAGIAEDLEPFPMRLLHFRRTFVEKLFTIHARVEKVKAEGSRLGTYARHYYDLYCLAQQPDIADMLSTSEYEAIRIDYDRLSSEAYPRNYVPPADLRFSASDALFPPEPLRSELSRAYDEQCQTLCFGAYPPFSKVVACFEGLRERL